MKDKTIFSSIGIILFFILTAIDKFIVELHPALYITIGITSITLIIIGFLHDKKKQPLKKKIKTILLALLITILITIIYINPIYVYRNIKLENHLDKIITKQEIKSKELIPFEYDKAYIIMPYNSKEAIEKELGLKSRYIKDNNINDNTKELIIIKNNKVISSIFIPVNINIQAISDDNSITIKKDTYYYVYKNNNDYNLIETPISKEETYYDITYTIPGLWWEEDDEEPGKFYYLDINDDIENLTIKTLDNFKESKYLKNLEVLETENLTNQFYEIFYYKIKKENNYVEQRIILKDEKTYEFILYSKESNSVLYKNKLLDIIESIK